MPSQAAPEWFLEQLGTVDSEGRRYSRVSIETGSRRNRLTQVAIVTVREDADPTTILAKVDRLARAHASKVVRVSLLRLGESVPEDAMLWEVDQDDDDDLDDQGDEPGPEGAMKNATAGLLRQAYSHNDRLLDRMLALHGATLSHVLEENGRLREERADVHQQYLASLKMIRDVEDEAAQVARGSRREEAIFGTLGTLVQAAAVRIAGKGAGGGPLPAAIGDLMKSFSPKQIESITSQLTTEQLQLFVSIQSSVMPEPEPEPESAGQTVAQVVPDAAGPEAAPSTPTKFGDAPSE